jgi:vacuolar iron transporter family protein
MPGAVLERTAQWLRPHVLEASDGILTTAGICEGLAGAGVSSKVLIFAGLTGLVAGALGMGGHEYSVLAAERDHQLAQLASERHQLETAPDAELDELTQLYVSRGLSPDLASRVAIELTAHDALKAHAEAELGIITPASETDPFRGAAAAAAAFAAGALLPVLAMVLLPGAGRASATFVIVVLALALTGWLAARISDVRPARLILRTASVGVVAMIITYAAGSLFKP